MPRLGLDFYSGKFQLSDSVLDAPVNIEMLVSTEPCNERSIQRDYARQRHDGKNPSKVGIPAIPWAVHLLKACAT
jgi:hypothetical protein